MEENKKKLMMAELNERLEKNVYDTPSNKKRVLLDKLALGSRIYFIIRYSLMIFSMSLKAQRGNYAYDETMELGLRSFRIIEDVGAKVHIEGIDNIKKVKDEPVVFVGNHMSTLETMIFPAIIYPIKKTIFVAKKSLLDFPIFGHVMRATEPIAVGRTNPREDLKIVMDEGVKALKEGKSIVIFQQSHRDPNFDPKNFSSLGIKLAQKAGVKVVPFALKTDFWGNAKKIRDFGPIRRKEPVCFSFGEAIEVENLGKDTNDKVINYIQEKLTEWKHNPNPNNL